MDFRWSIIQLQPSPEFYEQRKVFRKVVGPNAVADYDEVMEKAAGSLVQGLSSFTGNPLPRFYEYVQLHLNTKYLAKLPPSSIGKLITTIAYGELVYREEGKALVKTNTEALELVTYAFGQPWLVNMFPISVLFLSPTFSPVFCSTFS
jgi:hypothetical protein